MRRRLLSSAAKSSRVSSRKISRFRASSAKSDDVTGASVSAAPSGGGEGSCCGGVHFRREALPRRLPETRTKGRSSTASRRVAWRASIHLD